MPRVVALYRNPLKGFTPEKCDTFDGPIRRENRR